MKQKSLKKNFLYNSLLKVSNIIFPIITFPYVARILLAEGIGKVEFSLSVIQYFILLSQAGIPTYAVRECAKYRNNKDKLSKTVQEILLINFPLIVLSYIILFISLFSLKSFYIYKNLLIIMSVNIISTNIGIEWFYQATEEYRLITIRNILVRLFTLLLVFLFVKNENDYIVYGVILVLAVSLGYLYNFIYANRYISLFKKYKNYNLKRHVKSIIILFGMSLSVSIYVNLDKVMLGLISGDKYVGLYTAANKIVKIILSIITSLGTVLLPRMSFYIQTNNQDEINKLIKTAFDFIVMISMPIVIGLIMLSDSIILFFAGVNYYDAITTIRILSPIVFAIGLSNLIGIQILVSHGKEKLTLLSTIIGSIVNFTFNFILIPKYKQNGAAVGTLIAEFTVTVVQIFLAQKYLKGNIKVRNIFEYVISSISIVLICMSISYITKNLVYRMAFSVILSSCSYFGILYVIRNEFVFQIINSYTNKLKSRFLQKR